MQDNGGAEEERHEDKTIIEWKDGDTDRWTCKVTFEKEVEDELMGRNNPSNPTHFGLRYFFNLNDSDSSAAVEAPEYLIVPTALEKVAKMAGLKMVVRKNFQQFICECADDENKLRLMQNMHVFNVNVKVS